jgi:integrase
MDLDALRAWGLTDYKGGQEIETVRGICRRVQAMERQGFDWGKFLASPQGAKEEARRFRAELAMRRKQKPYAEQLYVQALNWATQFHAERDPSFEGLHWRAPERPRSQLKKYTEAEMACILAYRNPRGNLVVEKRRRALVWMAWATGLRRGELADLRVRDLRPARGTVLVSRPRKDGMRREIPLPADAWGPTTQLPTWLRARPVPSDDDWLWTTDTGGVPRRMGAAALYNDDLYHMRRDLGLRYMDFRRFRHYNGKKLAHAFVPLQIGQQFLGHANPKSTKVYYDELDPDQMADAFAKHGLEGFRSRTRSKGSRSEKPAQDGEDQETAAQE